MYRSCLKLVCMYVCLLIRVLYIQRFVILHVDTYWPTVITNLKLAHTDLLKIAERSLPMGSSLELHAKTSPITHHRNINILWTKFPRIALMQTSCITFKSVRSCLDSIKRTGSRSATSCGMRRTMTLQPLVYSVNKAKPFLCNKTRYYQLSTNNLHGLQ